MKRAKHREGSIYACPACITQAEIERMPWQRHYSDVVTSKAIDYNRRHNQAIARRVKAHAMLDCGLVKVKGALGGTYWE